MKKNNFSGKHIIKAIAIALATMMTISPITAMAQGVHNVDSGVAFSLVEHSTVSPTLMRNSFRSQPASRRILTLSNRVEKKLWKSLTKKQRLHLPFRLRRERRHPGGGY